MAVTQPTDASVDDFLAAVVPAQRRQDALDLRALMETVTGQEATMWGPSIVGFGEYRYAYPSGRTGTMPRVGFSPRRPSISLYGLKDHPAAGPLLDALGPHTEGVGCVYVKKLGAVDHDVLARLIELAHDGRADT